MDFLTFCFKQILELFNIIKIKVKNENISAFEGINRNEIINKINSKIKSYNTIINDEFRHLEDIINNNIYYCGKTKSSFEDMVWNNNRIFERSINNISENCDEFDEFLKEEYHNYIGKLNLEEMEKSKQEFEENINHFKTSKIEKSLSASNFISHLFSTIISRPIVWSYK